MDYQERIKWFKEARFGMFLHWGLYSQLAATEWAFRLNNYTVKEYAKIAETFKPQNFDPDLWAKTAKKAGMKYMVFTTRHCDGFCLYDSRVSDFTSVKTAAKRDFTAEYAEACRKAGLKVGFYYSLVDWRYKGGWDHDKYPESAEAMVRQAHGQVRELMTNYGKIDILWYDANKITDWKWEEGKQTVPEFWRSQELNEMVRKLQPHILINNRSGTGTGDFVTPERKIEAADQGIAWESCLTMDPLSWGHVAYNPLKKSASQVIRDLVEVASGGGNMLLNTAPKADGSLVECEVKSILEAGKWLKKNGQAIYGSVRSPLNALNHYGPNGTFCRWIGSADPKVHYLALLGWFGSEFCTVRIDGEVESITMLATGEDVQFRRESWGRLVLENLPVNPPDKHITMFKMKFKNIPKITDLIPKGELIESEL
jgi:alpha-L-fucosidase